jgi:hypothetical protein
MPDDVIAAMFGILHVAPALQLDCNCGMIFPRVDRDSKRPRLGGWDPCAQG